MSTSGNQQEREELRFQDVRGRDVRVYGRVTIILVIILIASLALYGVLSEQHTSLLRALHATDTAARETLQLILREEREQTRLLSLALIHKRQYPMHPDDFGEDLP